MSDRLIRTAVVLMFLLTCFSTGSARSASVKPLWGDPENVFIREIEFLADENSLSSALLIRSVASLNAGLNIISKETAGNYLKILASISGSLTTAKRNSAALSGYLTANSSRLKKKGYDRFIPLASMDRKIEAPYFKALEGFLEAAVRFVQYSNENLEKLGHGNQEIRKRFNELNAEYLKQMEMFNLQSIERGQRIAEMGSQYPNIWEMIP